MPELVLGQNLDYSELANVSGLKKLDKLFLHQLKASSPILHDSLLAYRQGNDTFSHLQISELLINCASVLEENIASLFNIEAELQNQQQAILSHNPVFVFKKLFVQRRARRRLLKKEEFKSFAELDRWLDQQLEQTGSPNEDRELATATFGQALLEDTEKNAGAIEQLTRWCIRALTDPEAKKATADWVSLRLPQGIDFANLVPIEPVANDVFGRVQIRNGACHKRDGFKLTDLRMGQRAVQSEIDYCIYCHDHDGDFCSKGFPEKKGEPDKGLKTNPLGVVLTGCPLDEKVSEMHLLKRDGHSIGALAMIMVDNPMCPATGHRICNDCMKACIYQKQNPVNIPEIETRVLTDVLALPWGVEIYDLLTRWNPLRATQWIQKPYNGLKALVAGMGPAGFTLSHHLLMEGFAVVGIDGLKIEPLPEQLVGKPIRDYSSLEEQLDSRVMAGFGGVAEYGITVRWDKNFLKLIYLTLMRRQYFQVFGGIRFGGTLTVDNAWELGFDHVAIAVGAGLPTAIPIPGSLAPGMRQANDFLMALQLTGAAKADSLANLQVRMPAVVIGGGLTSIDTATEVRAYYLAQVEKIYTRYQVLKDSLGEHVIRQGLDDNSLAILDDYLMHGKAVVNERQRASGANEEPDFQPLIEQWGGVTVVYRRPMQDSPAYTRNHEEITKAMQEGIYYADHLSPIEAKLDKYGQVDGLVCVRTQLDEDQKLVPTNEQIVIPARAILVATGAKPNIAYHFEHRGTFDVEDLQYKTHIFKDGEIQAVDKTEHCKDPAFGAFTSYDKHNHHVTFIGDTHPDFNGNVVKAIASGMRIYPKIVETFGDSVNNKGNAGDYKKFRQFMQDRLQPVLKRITRHTPSIVELIIRAPQAARRFQPGQIFRLQNYETRSAHVGNTRLQTETLALTGSRVDADAGEISLIVRERGASTRLCATLKTGDPVALMGPGGVRTKIHAKQTIMIAGDWLAATILRTLGPAYRAAGSKVLFVGYFSNREEIFCRDELEAASDSILWVTADGEPVNDCRPQDAAATGELINTIEQYAKDELNNSKPAIPLETVDVLHITGTNCQVRKLRDAKGNELKKYFSKNPPTTGAIYSTMQCMLKGVCSQCLQWQIDPKTGQRTKAVFTCSWQDEPIDIVDMDALDDRLKQNHLQEHLANLWLTHLFETNPVEKV